MDFFSDEEQLNRSLVKRAPDFKVEMRRLWDLLSRDEGINEKQYTSMMLNFCKLVVPPPWNEADVVETAADDWVKDLAWATENGLTVPNPHSDKDREGGAALAYGAFNHAVFALVDTWTGE